MFGLFIMPSLPAQDLVPHVGMVIKASATIKPGDYLLPIEHPDSKPVSAIVIEGDGITVDFQGAILRGTPASTEPDKRRGTGIIVRGKNVTVKNAVVRGYKNGLVAFGSTGVKVLDSDFSYNWKQRLGSTLEREDVSDWMSYHHNDDDQWLLGKDGEASYGGAIYLSRCDDFEVKGCTATGGQNGLMVSRSNRGTVWNNNFSFLSSLGIGMYRSSDNSVMHNNIDWCVRGYSHGVYNRGQDSAGMLIYEQSHRNLFAYNSVTHGGDGFFLWAGQSTMDNGQGGCNDNLLYGNDFSHAPTNGIEATFSRNKFQNNLILECWHGIWGGYSYETAVLDNVFGLNAQAIAWEHGQDNRIEGNVFHRDREGIHLWMNPTQDPNWGYPKNRDTRSRGYKISNNSFTDIATATLRLKDTADVTLDSNSFMENGSLVNLSGVNPNLRWVVNTYVGTEEGFAGADMTGFASRKFLHDWVPPDSTMQASGNPVVPFDLDREAYLERFEVFWFPWPNRTTDEELTAQMRAALKDAPKPLEGGIDPFLKQGALRGRRYILVDEWGPYDFRSPLIWPRGEATDERGESVQRFEILGPVGKWRVVSTKGVDSISAREGSFPAVVDVTLEPGVATDVEINLEFVGEEITTRFGEKVAANKPYPFRYTKFYVPIAWDVKWFKWDETNDPRTKEAEFKALIAGTPIKSEKKDKLEYTWYGAIGEGLPADHFATLAEGTLEIPKGDYELQVTTDDGARVWVDDKLVIADAWKYQGPTRYSAKLALGGKHRIRVEHFEIDGFSTIQLRIVR